MTDARLPQDNIDKREVLMRTDIVRLISENLPLKRQGHNHWALCPFHGERTPSFAVDSRKQICKCFSCGVGGDALWWIQNYFKVPFRDALEDLAIRAGMIDGQRRRLIPAISQEELDRVIEERRQAEEAEKEQKREWAGKIWNDSQKENRQMIERYLRGRCIDLDACGGMPPTLRQHNSLFNVQTGQRSLAMVAGIQDVNGKLMAVHRTFLTEHDDGSVTKQHLEKTKMVLGPKQGCAIRLTPPQKHLAIAEGIETGLSVRQVTGLAVWASITLGNILDIKLPDVVEIVTICCDNDSKDKDRQSHLKTYHAAAERFIKMGKKVHLAWPPKGMDFNDWLKQAGKIQ